MTYLRSLFLNFLLVFFVNRMIPGIQVKLFEEVPNVGADLVFSLILGFLNAAIFPLLMILEIKPTNMKIAILSGLVSFSGFLFLAFFPLGVRVTTFGAGFLAGLIVWAGSFFTNYLEWRTSRNLPK